ncbi:MAG: HAD-IA family hydrolase [Gammaproteobacteria bacterium]
MIDLSDVDVLLFDLGGVIINIDFDRAVHYWATGSEEPFEKIKAKFTVDENYRRHERGEISSEAFFRRLRQTLGIDLSLDEMAAGWNALIIDEVQGIAQLLDAIPCDKSLYAFSNINPAHLDSCWSLCADVLTRFEKIFASSEIGRRKPEPDAYQRVISALGVPAQKILFFDDLIENVEAARRSGMQSVHVRSTSDIETALKTIV